MSTQQISDWVQRLRVGTLELFDLKAFEKMRIADLARQLRAVYPVRFLERDHRTKKEIGLVQSVTRSNRWVTLLLHRCLLLTSEHEQMTAMAVMTHIRFRPSRQGDARFELTSGAGFSVYHDPDGWRIKLLQERTVSLTEGALHTRGWILNGTETAKASFD
jgi:hypothetical protein